MVFVQLYPILLSFLFAWFSLSVVAQTSRNITLGTSLTAGGYDSFRVSPSGDFAFGFKQIEEDGFLLAIWFNKIAQGPVVWSSNGQNLAPMGSKVELTSNGWFQLVGPNGKQISGASPSRSGVAYAAMLDSGNFVLVGQDSQTLWRSFDQPTDTILPEQILDQPAHLVARYLENNYSRGRFRLDLQGDGNLVLYTTHFPMDDANFAYWSTQVMGTGFSLNFNQTGYLVLHADNGSIISTISPDDPYSTQDYYQRAVLDYDGVFRHYIHPKNSSSGTGSWSTLSVTPSNICLRVREGSGSGACGFNSYCTFDGTYKSCHCPYGYSFIDPSDVMNGCKQDFVSQSCDKKNSSETDLFDFDEMPNTDWPLSDYGHFSSVTEDWCRQACLEDCFCSVIIFRDRECWKMKQPLSNGVTDPSVGGKAMIKTRKDSSTSILEDIDRENDRSKLIIIFSTLLSSSVFLNLVLLVATCLVAYRCGHNYPKVDQPVQITSTVNVRSFTYEELMKGTNGFIEEIGRGAFSTVYKGFLPDKPSNLIAVKKLNMVKGSEKEFEAEVSTIGRTHHRNLVQLLGFCNEGEHRLLVYEFMSRGTLASFLFKDQRPTWSQRVEIAIGIAKGLLYLHEECSTQIIHCDIKPQNILLDDFYKAKISDFGLAKLLDIDQTVTTTAIRGTKGYVAAEWFKNKPITMKVDVYSFGVLLIELICCRKNFDMNAEDENKMVLIDWVYDCFHGMTLDLLVEDDEEAQIDMKRVEEYVKIGIWCIQEDPSTRPTMRQVVNMLEGFMDMSNPPDLSSFTS